MLKPFLFQARIHHHHQKYSASLLTSKELNSESEAEPIHRAGFLQILLTALGYKAMSGAYRKEPGQTIIHHLSGFISHGFLVYLAAMVTFHFK